MAGCLAARRFPRPGLLRARSAVSRNTVLTAYDELKARGLITDRRGAGMRVGSGAIRGFDVRGVLREAQYPGIPLR